MAEARMGRPTALRSLMRKLASRVAREQWTTPLQTGLETYENPRIPSGYTYLLQFIAHDLVHSSISMAAAPLGAPGLANTRFVPLSLETIYGGGPAVTPQPYEFDADHRNNIGLTPRTRFRVGRSRNGGTTLGCPFRDIGRAIPADVRDSGLAPPERLDLQLAFGSTGSPWRTEALLADPRNDDHALLSQLTLLFQLLHNHIMDMLPVIGALASLPAAERALRRFMCAQLTVSHIYRAILKQDVLELILHPDIHLAYNVGNPRLLDDGYPESRKGIPFEFSHGAFRFGHAMIRPSYLVNSDEQLSSLFALQQSSLRSPRDVPIDHSWLVDWSRFFKTSNRTPNLSRRIGPSYSGSLLDTWTFPALVPGTDTDGLANRDFISSAYASMWSVPALCKELRSQGMTTLVPDFSDLQTPLRDWLSRAASMHDCDPLSPIDIDVLVADPPLAFFVLFEAAQCPAVTGLSATGSGQHLGPVGSIIVAETILGSLMRNPIAYEAQATLKERVAETCGQLVGDRAVLDGIPEITHMHELLKFMTEGGAIAPSIPA